MSTFQLLTKRKFAPFFSVQFLGAFNDNLFKNALVILIARTVSNQSESGLLINLAAAVFILPFVLFSPIAGQIGDQTEKSKLIKHIKFMEIPIMLLGVLGFYLGSNAILLSALALMGIQSAFFGPVKYGILPQTLKKNELMDGNGLVEMSTFLAILLGTMAGGFLIIQSKTAVCITMIATALVGWLLSFLIPKAEATSDRTPIKLNFFKESINLFKIAKKTKSIYLSIIGISWYWFIGALILSQIPNYTIHTLRADESVVTFLLAVISISIGLGSIVCAKLSRGDIEIGMVPLGAIGISLPLIDLYFLQHTHHKSLLTLGEFLSLSGFEHLRVVLDLALFGFFGSFFIVPLYALIQHRGEEKYRSRLIAANNILNSLFMVGSAIMAMALLSFGLSISDIFLIVGILNIAVSIYIFKLIPEFMIRFILWLLASTIYKISYKGRSNFPSKGPAILIANHVTFVDWLILSAAYKRPITFVMDHQIYKNPFIGKFLKLGKAIPIASEKENIEIKKLAYEKVSESLLKDDIICIFPEGKLSSNGGIDDFKPGILKILEKNPVPVVPIGLNGLWESIFARNPYNTSFLARLLRLERTEIYVNIGKPISPDTDLVAMKNEILSLLK